MRHVLRGVEIRSLSLVARCWNGKMLIRFEGLRGSLEITSAHAFNRLESIDLPFGPRGVLFSHSSHIRSVTEMHIVDCTFEIDEVMERFKRAMPNVKTMSFFRCDRPNPFALLTSKDASSPPFPHLERVMVLGRESGLQEMARNRRDLGVPLETLVLGRNPEGFDYERLKDYATLAGLVGYLRVECPVEITKWGARNEIVDVWSAADAPTDVVRPKIV